MKIFECRSNGIQYFDDRERPLQEPRENEIPEDMRAIGDVDKEDTNFLGILLDTEVETPSQEAAKLLNVELIRLDDAVENEPNDDLCSESSSRELSTPRLLNSAPRQIAALVATGVFLSFSIMGVCFLFLSSDESSGSGLQGRVTSNSSSEVALKNDFIPLCGQVLLSIGVLFHARNIGLGQDEHRANESIQKILGRIHQKKRVSDSQRRDRLETKEKRSEESNLPTFKYLERRELNLQRLDPPNKTTHTSDEWRDSSRFNTNQSDSAHNEIVVSMEPDLTDAIPVDSQDENPSNTESPKLPDMPVVLFFDKFEENNSVCPFESDGVSVGSEQKIFGFEKTNMPLTLPFIPLNMSRYKVVSEAPKLPQPEEPVFSNEQEIRVEVQVVIDDKKEKSIEQEKPVSSIEKPVVGNRVSQKKEEPSLAPSRESLQKKIVVPSSKEFPICDLRKLGNDLLPAEMQKSWEKFLKKLIKELSKQKKNKNSNIDIKTLQNEGLTAYKENRFPEWAKQHLPLEKQKKSKKK